LEEKIIGLIMVVSVTEQNGVLAYYLNRNYWSQGYTTEAAIAVIGFMFAEVGIEKVSAKHSVKNPASGRVLQKAGMTFIEHKEHCEYYQSKSEWQDCDFYEIIKKS